MKILIDMDNVCANLIKKWLDVYNIKHNDSVKIEDIEDWKIDKHAKKCIAKDFYALIDEADFFADLEVMPDAIEVTQRLQKNGHELFFATATPLASKTAAYDKNMWVNKYFPHIGAQNIFQTHIKEMINGDVLFDDSPSNLSKFPGIKIVMNYAFNKDVKADYRVNTWLEFEKVILSLTNQ